MQRNDHRVRMEIFYHKTIDSTNEEAKRKAREGLTEGLFIAETQTSGRGRLGRNFYSPKDTGLYMSLLIPSESVKGYFQNSGLRVAVAVWKTIEKIFSINLSLKWVNDLYYDEKKVGGILLETSEGKMIVGIGLNLTTTNFPEKIKDMAGTLLKEDYGQTWTENERTEKKKYLAIELSKAISEELQNDSDDWVEIYNKQLLWKNGIISYGDVNKDGCFIPKGEGRVLKATTSGELMIECVNERSEESAGRKTLLSTGEISIRRKTSPSCHRRNQHPAANR